MIDEDQFTWYEVNELDPFLLDKVTGIKDRLREKLLENLKESSTIKFK